MENLFREIKSWNLKLSNPQKLKFEAYLKYLIEWNRKFNLVGFGDRDKIISNLFLESSALLKYIDFVPQGTVLDIGTGAGFPGIPLKILRGDLNVFLVDSTRKKMEFLKQIDNKLNLGLNLILSRSEELAHDFNYREKFDYVAAKAVAELPVLIEYAVPFLKIGGRLIALKGPKIFDEIKMSERAIGILNSSLEEIIEVKYNYFPPVNYKIVIIKKRGHSLPEYPRRTGIPRKKPL